MVISIWIGMFYLSYSSAAQLKSFFSSSFKGLKSPPESLSDLGAIESLRAPGKVLSSLREHGLSLPYVLLPSLDDNWCPDTFSSHVQMIVMTG